MKRLAVIGFAVALASGFAFQPSPASAGARCGFHSHWIPGHYAWYNGRRHWISGHCS